MKFLGQFRNIKIEGMKQQYNRSITARIRTYKNVLLWMYIVYKMSTNPEVNIEEYVSELSDIGVKMVQIIKKKLIYSFLTH